MEVLSVAGVDVPPATLHRGEITLGNLPTGAPLPVPLVVVNGSEPGPSLFLAGCLHGDEIIGVEIIRRIARAVDPAALRGSIIATPIVNVFGFVQQSRYLPDRRDLNRSFPGSPNGSLAARLAHFLITNIAAGCSHAIDFHTGSDNRTNLPHIRANLSDPNTNAFALAFGTGLVIDANTRDGSLRLALAKRGIPCLVYEAGEAHRFDRRSVRTGVDGTLRAMHSLGMIDAAPPSDSETRVVQSTRWVRARRAGILTLDVELGNSVRKGEVMGTIRDGVGQRVARVNAPSDGVVLGLTRAPLVHRGDGLVHIAE